MCQIGRPYRGQWIPAELTTQDLVDLVVARCRAVQCDPVALRRAVAFLHAAIDRLEALPLPAVGESKRPRPLLRPPRWENLAGAPVMRDAARTTPTCER